MFMQSQQIPPQPDVDEQEIDDGSDEPRPEPIDDEIGSPNDPESDAKKPSGA